MPNHVLNEIVFFDIDAAKRAQILTMVRNVAGEIDFNILVKKPLNLWDGNIGLKHEQAFRSQLGMDWARKNWGTKWNAYGHDQGGKYKSIAESDTTIVLTFQTAWRPPYPWLVACFNFFKISFDHNWLDEGKSRAVSGRWNWPAYADDKARGEAWSEEDASDELHKRMHKLMWGVEAFEDDAA